PITVGTGATLRLLAAALDAHAVAEIGTGTGTSAAWMLSAMAPDAVLTSIDIEGEYQAIARQALALDDVKSPQVRLITGRALKVLPRLAANAYDLVFVDGDPDESADYLLEALRILRPGGIVALDRTLWHDRVPDPARRDRATVQMRELVRAMRDEPGVISALLPCGDGLLAAVKTASSLPPAAH
ncbi:MAG: class I SAM-dependent methyltransferase, partial [Bowdeniella nasicola]|nr:class I SAM-dependent methyltransferase [Bowdeniella nasicola]